MGLLSSLTSVVASHPALAALVAGIAVGGALFMLRGSLKEPKHALHVCITGGSKGLGKALAKQHLLRGDKVVICGRNAKDLKAAVEELSPYGTIYGTQADVSNNEDVEAFVAFALEKLEGHIDCFINNAAIGNGVMTSVADMSPEAISSIVGTNLVGTLLCCRACIASNGKVRHIFNMDGAGSAGFATPRYAVYGASKAALPQLMKSLVGECKKDGKEGTGETKARGKIGIHTLSPGMVITDLLLGRVGSSISESNAADETARKEKLKSARIFNILAERPETVAGWMVPKVRSIAATEKSGTYYRYLTPASAALAFATSLIFSAKNRLIDETTGEEMRP
jgi:chlorophyll(ide) b reductase